jgi:hypothetical protein
MPSMPKRQKAAVLLRARCLDCGTNPPAPGYSFGKYDALRLGHWSQEGYCRDCYEKLMARLTRWEGADRR